MLGIAGGESLYRGRREAAGEEDVVAGVAAGRGEAEKKATAARRPVGLAFFVAEPEPGQASVLPLNGGKGELDDVVGRTSEREASEGGGQEFWTICTGGASI